MKTRNVTTRFMRAKATSEVFEMMAEEHGMGVMCDHEIDYESALFSERFIEAMEKGIMPILGSHKPAHEAKMDQEYHHLIHNGECYTIYFAS